jgi:outer membrane protein assembly factor BamB
MNHTRKVSLVVLLLLACAPGRGADWLTDGGNPQRTAWQQDEKVITTANVGGMKLLWKLKLDNQPRVMHSLFPPLIIERLKTPAGTRQVAIEAGSSDNIYAIDVEKGEVIWKKHFESAWTPPANGRGGPGIICPGGQTATPVIGPAGTPGKFTIYAASWDGMLHRLNAADGEDIAPPSKWMPPNGKPYALNLFNNVLYTHTAQSCGGNPNMAYSYDLETDKVGTWGPAGGGMWGRTGPAMSANGTMYTGTGDGQWDPASGVYGSGIIGVKQDPQTKALTLADFYGPSNAEFLVKRDLDMQVTPAIFSYKGRELMVDAGKECRIYLMDTKSIGGDDHRTPLYRSPQICNEDYNSASAGIWGSMATWEDTQGTRWIMTPIWGPPHSAFKAPVEYGAVNDGAIVAFRLEEKAGKLTLVPAWISQNMNWAEPPVIANGIVFAYGNGEDTTQSYPDIGLADTPERRIAGSTHAILYALDAQTGKTLWSSGDQIASWNHWSGLTVANGRVYIGTYDSNLYCFGIR